MLDSRKPGNAGYLAAHGIAQRERCGMKKPTNTLTLAKGVCQKLRTQMDESREAHLFFRVFTQAATDHFSPAHSNPPDTYDRDSAARYLSRAMPHLEAIGIEPDYARRLFKEAGIPLPEAGRRAA
ncbi:MAG: hypothetical protein LAT50_19455 [Ectothiorhodospiraceae bacterium]|nr:hypothetical protein [Ectothiorhodospiraceae bacterium]